MKNVQLINSLHSIYPELLINIYKIKGYSDDEIKKLNVLYRINVTKQLYDFLSCMGVAVVVFWDDPLIMMLIQVNILV
ncbi:hypothetical protein [Proteus sp. fly-1067]|uniref:hypothetical protein n=1 Tax=Proteus sp. fly-1067 TaxID=3136674 RepID=UPI0032DB523C